MGSALSSSIVEEELNGNSVTNTPDDEKLLVVKKKNRELEQKASAAEEKFKEIEEKNEDIIKTNQVWISVKCQKQFPYNVLGMSSAWRSKEYAYLNSLFPILAFLARASLRLEGVVIS